MNHAKISTGLILASILLSGCAGYGKPAATEEGYAAALANAKKSLKIAKSANFEWRDSGKLLKKAAKAAKKGDFEAATKKAKKADRQGQLALAQSRDQANAGPR